MIVKGEIGQQILIKAEITAIEVSRDYRDNGVRTEYTLRLHESDALGDTHFKLLSSDVCFEVPDEVPEEIEDATLPEDDEYKRFAEFVVGTCTSFAESNEDKAKDIINEIIYNQKKYPKLSLLWDQYCGNFS